MTYRVLGNGPPLFLVPGIASTYRTYALLLNRLAEPVSGPIVYDYPGDQPGDGAGWPGSATIDLVDDLFGLIDHLNIGRVFLAGLSFGSTITLKALHREPRRFPRAAVQGALRLSRLLSRRAPGHSGSVDSCRATPPGSRSAGRSLPTTARLNSPRSGRPMEVLP